MKTHVGGEPYKCELCDKTFTHRVDLDYHLKTHSGEKLCESELCQSIESSMTQRWLGSTSHKRFSICADNHNDSDERVLLTTEIMQNLSSRQSMESSQDEKQHSGGHSTFNADIDCFIMRPYGCGMCDEMFEIEEEFVEHCYNHYYDDPQKDTFLELFHHFILKPYGCGMCDEMFEIEKEFVQHCYNHYCEDPQKDTFLELFEKHLLSYSTRIEKKD